MERTIRRGDIYYADLNPVVGSEQGGTRPVLIISNDIGNKHSPTVIIAAITSKQAKSKLPTHTAVGDLKGLDKDSIILLEQIRTIDKQRLRQYVGLLPEYMMATEKVWRSKNRSTAFQYCYCSTNYSYEPCVKV